MSIDVSTLAVEVRSTGVKETSQELNKLFVEAGKAYKRVDTLTASVEKLAQAFTKGSAAAMAYQQAVANANRQVGGHNAATSALTSAMQLLSGAISTLNTNIGNLGQNTQRSTQNIRSHTNAMADAQSMARGLAGSLGALWVTYGRAVPLAAGLGIGASFSAIIKQGKDVENTLEGIRVKGEESYQSIDAMRAAITSLGQGIYGPQEVAKALETLVMAGLNAKEALVGVKEAMNLATVGGTSVEKSAYTLVQVTTALGYSVEGFGRVSDVIAKTAAVSMSSVESLSEAFKSGSVVGKLYGASLVDIGTGLAALSQLGIQGSAAGTSLKNFYKELASGADKVKNTFAAMGVKSSDLKDTNGDFLDMVTVVDKLSVGLNKLSPAQQKLALNNLANERGLKTLVEVLELYRKKTEDGTNALQDFRDKIADSYAFTAIGAAQMALTVENQFKAVKNTLSTTFVQAFDGIQPELLSFATQMKAIFRSDEFKRGIQAIAVSLSELALWLVSNASKIALLIEALLLFKSVMFVGGLIQGFAVGMQALTVAFETGRVAAMAFQVSLGIVGVLLLAAGAAWAYYNAQKNNQQDAKGKAALDNLTEFNVQLESEITRMQGVNTQLQLGKTLQDAHTEATYASALALAEKNKQSMIESAQARKSAAEAALANNKDQTSVQVVDGRVVGRTVSPAALTLKKEVTEATLALDTARAAGDALYARTLNNVEQARREAKVTDAYVQRNMKQAREDGLSHAGDGTLPTAGNKAENAIKSETISLLKSAEGYKARTKALQESAATGVKVMADSEVMRVRAELAEGKYGSKVAQTSKEELLSAAAAKDAAKFDNEKAIGLEELSRTLNEKLATEKAGMDEANSGHTKLTSVIEAETAAKLKALGASDAEAESYLSRARAIGEYTAAKERATKFNKATATLNEEAASYFQAGDALAEYGKAGKQTALQVAALKVVQDSINPTTQSGIIAARMQAAATADLGKAYKDMWTLANTTQADTEKLDAQILESILTSESEKVQVKHDTAMKAIAFSQAQVDAAWAAANSEGQATQKQIDDHKKAQSAIDAATSAVNDNTASGMTLARAKEMTNLIAESQNLGSVLQSVFGNAGAAIGGMVTAMAQLQQSQEAYNVALNEAAKLRAKGDNVKAVKVEQEATRTAQIAEVRGYANVLGAAKGLFSEKSKAYKVLGAAEKAFHVMEVALAMESMIRKIFFTEAVTTAKVQGDVQSASSAVSAAGIESTANMTKATTAGVAAVANQGSGDPYTAFFRIAAMAAIMAGLGLMIGGGSSSVSVPTEQSSEFRQAHQGTGTVLGDDAAKSDSIVKAMETLSSNSSIELTHSSQMLAALRNINDGIAGMAANISSSSGLRGTAADQLALGVGSSSGALGFSKSSTDLTDSGIVFGRKTVTTPVTAGPDDMAWVQEGDGNMVQVKMGRGGFGSTGGTTTTTAQTLGDVLGGGLSASGYADVHKTSSSWWGLSKSSSNTEELSGLDPALIAGMGRTLNSMFNSVIQAGSALGADPKTSAAVMKALNLDQLGLTRISLKGLSGTDVEKELQAAFSKAGDVMAKAVMPGLDEFQKVGEGYYATMVRVSSGVEKGQYVLEQLGIQAVAYTDIQNKQGDTATEMVRDSIVNAESYKRAATETEKAATDTVAAFLGLSGQLDDTTVIVTSNIGQIIEAFNGTADDMASLYKQLTALRDSFNATGLNGDNLSVDTIRGAGGLDALTSGLDSFVTNFFSEADQNAMHLATLTKEFAALGIALPTTKDGFVALVHAADDGTEAGNKLVGKLLTLADTFNTVSESAIKAATDAAQGAFDTLKRSVDAEKKRLTDLYNAQVDAIKKKQDLDTKAAQAQLKPAQTALADVQKIFEALQTALKSTTVDTAALNMARRQQAQGLLATAKQYTDGGGSLKDVAGLTDALTDVAKPSDQFFGTLEDYQRDQAKTKMLLTDLSAKGQHEVDKAQLTIDAINDTIDAIKQTATDQLDALQKAHDADMDRLDAIVQHAQDQLDALNGINTSVLSVQQAVLNFQYALVGAHEAKGTTATQAGMDAHQSLVTAVANKAVTDYGSQFGNDAYLDVSKIGVVGTGSDGYFNTSLLDKKISGAQAIADLYTSEGQPMDFDAAMKLSTGHTQAYWEQVQTLIDAGTPPSAASMATMYPGLAVGTNFVPGDMTANIHEGERIIPKADNAELMRRLKSPDESAQATKDLKDAVNELKQVIMAGDVANVQKTKELTKIFQRWDTNGMPTVRDEADV